MAETLPRRLPASCSPAFVSRVDLVGLGPGEGRVGLVPKIKAKENRVDRGPLADPSLYSRARGRGRRDVSGPQPVPAPRKLGAKTNSRRVSDGPGAHTRPSWLLSDQ